ncbi:MAG TPA: SDR family NAD(P)-dependent oxidoreductase, partial [Proteobacteria bacterium]|nr:SDR family NAD(P)-dependent oxidoreductase [Pseudomonadota bacterium]
MKEFSLEGRVAVITGASRGIGEAIAIAYSGLGAKCVIASRKEDALNEAAQRIEAATGNKPLVVPTHVAKLDQLEYLVNATLETFGQIDILVNNAATNPVFGPALMCDEAAWDKIMSVNLKGAFFLTKLVAEQMKKREYGKIINIASVAGFRVMPGLGIYSISKAGVIMMTKVLAFE